MNTWSKRVKLRMQELNMTQEVLAGKMGITRGAITHYLSGLRCPPMAKFQKLAAVLKTDPAWLQFGTVSVKAPVRPAVKKEKPLPIRLPVPVLSWEQAAEFTDVSKLDPKEIQEHIPHFYTDKTNWFALKVKNDAMSAPGTVKSFNEGNIIIVDPDKPLKHGSFVIAVLPKSKEATFKQYVIDAGVRYLKPLNPQYPTVQSNDSTHICGVVVHSITAL